MYLIVERDHEIAIDWRTVGLVFQGALFSIQLNLEDNREKNNIRGPSKLNTLYMEKLPFLFLIKSNRSFVQQTNMQPYVI